MIRAIRRSIGKRFSRTARTKLAQRKEFFRLLFLKKDIGLDSFVDRSVQVLGWNSVRIGHSSAVSEDCWLNVNHRDVGRKQIIIGNSCYIGKRNFFSAGYLIEVGDYCMTGIDCKLMSADHVFESPMAPYMTTGVTKQKTIRLGTNVWLGAGVVVIGEVSIGHGSIVGAGALVNKPIPPFSIVIGNPCRIQKRFDFLSDKWIDSDALSNASETAMPDESTYLEALKLSHPRLYIPLEATGRYFGDMS